MHMDIDFYRNSNQELKHLPKEVLELRYSYAEKLREQNIKLCKDERKRMIDEGYVVHIKRKSEIYTRSKSARKIIDVDAFEGKGELERLKQKQV